MFRQRALRVQVTAHGLKANQEEQRVARLVIQLRSQGFGHTQIAAYLSAAPAFPAVPSELIARIAATPPPWSAEMLSLLTEGPSAKVPPGYELELCELVMEEPRVRAIDRAQERLGETLYGRELGLDDVAIELNLLDLLCDGERWTAETLQRVILIDSVLGVES